jgi:hypothetical protein
MIDRTPWGQARPAPPPEQVFAVSHGTDGTLHATTTDGRGLTFGAGLPGGREGILRRFGAVWRPASDADLALLGSHPDGFAFIEQHGTATDAWVAVLLHTPGPRPEEPADDAARRWPGDEPPEEIEPPTYRRTALEVLADTEADL